MIALRANNSWIDYHENDFELVMSRALTESDQPISDYAINVTMPANEKNNVALGQTNNWRVTTTAFKLPVEAYVRGVKFFSGVLEVFDFTEQGNLYHGKIIVNGKTIDFLNQELSALNWQTHTLGVEDVDIQAYLTAKLDVDSTTSRECYPVMRMPNFYEDGERPQYTGWANFYNPDTGAYDYANGVICPQLFLRSVFDTIAADMQFSITGDYNHELLDKVHLVNNYGLDGAFGDPKVIVATNPTGYTHGGYTRIQAGVEQQDKGNRYDQAQWEYEIANEGSHQITADLLVNINESQTGSNFRFNARIRRGGTIVWSNTFNIGAGNTAVAINQTFAVTAGQVGQVFTIEAEFRNTAGILFPQDVQVTGNIIANAITYENLDEPQLLPMEFNERLLVPNETVLDFIKRIVSSFPFDIRIGLNNREIRFTLVENLLNKTTATDVLQQATKGSATKEFATNKGTTLVPTLYDKSSEEYDPFKYTYLGEAHSEQFGILLPGINSTNTFSFFGRAENSFFTIFPPDIQNPDYRTVRAPHYAVPRKFGNGVTKITLPFSVPRMDSFSESIVYFVPVLQSAGVSQQFNTLNNALDFGLLQFFGTATAGYPFSNIQPYLPTGTKLSDYGLGAHGTHGIGTKYFKPLATLMAYGAKLKLNALMNPMQIPSLFEALQKHEGNYVVVGKAVFKNSATSDVNVYLEGRLLPSQTINEQWE